MGQFDSQVCTITVNTHILQLNKTRTSGLFEDEYIIAKKTYQHILNLLVYNVYV